MAALARPGLLYGSWWKQAMWGLRDTSLAAIEAAVECLVCESAGNAE